MASFLRRAAHALFSKRTPPEPDTSLAAAPEPPAVESAAREPVDSDAFTRDWFEGTRDAGPRLRDSVASDPDSARWFRRPRYVVHGDALHRPSDVGAGK